MLSDATCSNIRPGNPCMKLRSDGVSRIQDGLPPTTAGFLANCHRQPDAARGAPSRYPMHLLWVELHRKCRAHRLDADGKLTEALTMQMVANPAHPIQPAPPPPSLPLLQVQSVFKACGISCWLGKHGKQRPGAAHPMQSGRNLLQPYQSWRKAVGPYLEFADRFIPI